MTPFRLASVTSRKGSQAAYVDIPIVDKLKIVDSLQTTPIVPKISVNSASVLFGATQVDFQCANSCNILETSAA